MISFREFLLSEEDEDDEYPSLFEYVDEHCKPFLSHLGIKADQVLDYPLFRGTSRDSMPERFKLSVRYDGGGYNHETVYECFTKSPRLDRRPLDTNPIVSNLVDEKFKQIFGWEPRKQGIFVVADEEVAGGYGRSCIFVPIGNFKYIWSPEVKDLSAKMHRAWRHSDLETKYLSINKAIQSAPGEVKDLFNDAFNSYIGTYTDKNLLEAITDKTDYEIMISCNKYLMILV
jgi:hypothetical protein